MKKKEREKKRDERLKTISREGKRSVETYIKTNEERGNRFISLTF